MKVYVLHCPACGPQQVADPLEVRHIDSVLEAWRTSHPNATSAFVTCPKCQREVTSREIVLHRIVEESK